MAATISLFLFCYTTQRTSSSQQIDFQKFFYAKKKDTSAYFQGWIKKVSIQNLNKSHFGLNNSAQYLISPVFKIILMTGISLAHMTISSTLFETIKHFQENYRIL